MAIGVFARATGVTTSALRFYDDCGLVRPDVVDSLTGYRYYSVEQIDEVVLIRRLREAGLPLVDVRRLLIAPDAVVEQMLADHLRTMEKALEVAHVHASHALAMIKSQRRGLSLPGPVLAEAIGQVTPAADRTGQVPALGGVLIDTTRQELRLVATDRYRLALRSIAIPGRAGRAATALVAAEHLDAARRWIGQQDSVELRFSDTRVHLEGPSGEQTLTTMDEEFPPYRQILDDLPRPVTQVVTPRERLLSALGDDPHARFDLAVDAGLRMWSSSSPATAATLPADVTGEPVAISFQFATLHPAVAASLGPDVMLQITQPDLPVIVRSANDGDFTTLVMPTRSTVRTTTGDAP